MVNKNYVRGRAFEYRVKKYLEDVGYLVVRSAGSKSPFDLVAIQSTWHTTSINFHEVLLVQCKYGAKISKKERDNLKIINNRLPVCVSVVIAWAKPNKPIMLYGCDGSKYYGE